jgi:hypothetical protein
MRSRNSRAPTPSLIATVVYMVNEGHVRFCGTFKGSRFDLASVSRA